MDVGLFLLETLAQIGGSPGSLLLLDAEGAANA